MVEECHGRSGTQAAPGETNITSIRADSKHSNTGPLTKSTLSTSQFCYCGKSVMSLHVVLYRGGMYQFSLCESFERSTCTLFTTRKFAT